MPLINPSKLAAMQKPAAKVTAEIGVVLDKKPMYKAIDAYAAAAEANADLKAQIKELEGKLIDLKPLEADLKTLATPHYPDEFADKGKEFTVESLKNKVKIGKMGTKRSIIDMAFIFAKMKKDQFLQACSFPLSAVDAYLTPDEQAQCIQSDDTTRNVSLVGVSETAKKKGK